MNNVVTALLRITALAGGAAAGALLARWLDEYMVAKSQQKTDVDKGRYAQGLGPVGMDAPVDTVNTIYTINTIVGEDEAWDNEQ
ncbi:MAG TPA: hypothetical protein VHZ51_30640 [Ktedonobacteraceae bacterium]|jgi:hypothetical protein|nr:hypothetical protein [Ktedonobacteraceae bacterium]